MKKITILIPIYNHLEHTKKCLRNLADLILNTTFQNTEYEIIVIDDGSTDGSSEWLNLNFPDIKVLLGDGNLWWSGGINMGANYAQDCLNADYLLLWNNDIIPAEDYFVQVDKLLYEFDENTIIGSKIFYLDQRKINTIWSFGGIFNPKTGKRYMIGNNQLDSENFCHPVDVDWLPGMGTLVPVNIVKKIGLWDAEVFPQYHGDSDFTFRAKTAGFNIKVFPQLILWNDKSVSGITHGGTIKGFIKTLTDRRSNVNMRENFNFYRRHVVSIRAYSPLIVFYMIFFGSFCKWKIIDFLGLKKEK